VKTFYDSYRGKGEEMYQKNLVWRQGVQDKVMRLRQEQIEEN